MSEIETKMENIDPCQISVLKDLSVFAAWPWLWVGIWYIVSKNNDLIGWTDGCLVLIPFVLFQYLAYFYLYFKNQSLLLFIKHAFFTFSESKNKNDKSVSRYAVTRNDIALNKIFLLLFLEWWILVPMDCNRSHWTSQYFKALTLHEDHILIKWFFYAIYLLAYCLLFGSMLGGCMHSKRHRSKKILVQGMFAFVRHPAYLGVLLLIVGATCFLQTVMGAIASILCVVMLVIRVQSEESTLEKSCDEYNRYKQRVKYKMIPILY